MTAFTAMVDAFQLAGGPRVVAASLNITPQAVYQWQRVPVSRVLALEALTGGAVPRWELRPDYYPPPKWHLPPLPVELRE